jgi:hypothetical protein
MLGGLHAFSILWYFQLTTGLLQHKFIVNWGVSVVSSLILSIHQACTKCQQGLSKNCCQFQVRKLRQLGNLPKITMLKNDIEEPKTLQSHVFSFTF